MSVSVYASSFYGVLKLTGTALHSRMMEERLVMVTHWVYLLDCKETYWRARLYGSLKEQAWFDELLYRVFCMYYSSPVMG